MFERFGKVIAVSEAEHIGGLFDGKTVMEQQLYRFFHFPVQLPFTDG